MRQTTRLNVLTIALISATWALRCYRRFRQTRPADGRAHGAPAERALPRDPKVTMSDPEARTSPTVEDAQACRTPAPTSLQRAGLTPTRETGVVVVPPLPRLTPRKEKR